MSNTQFLVWKEQYNVGVEQLDADHKSIFETINTYYENIQNNTNPAIIYTILKKLQKYTRTHFKHEEEVLKSLNYPEFESQVKAHAALLRDTECLIDQYHNQTPGIAMDLFQFLKAWWSGHILTMDSKYSTFLTNATDGREKTE